MTPSTVSNSSSAQTSPPAERPERSRNAKAQARHRAKRKAYIEQLEQTVVKLQTILNLSPEQVASLPPPSVRIRELEAENLRLRHELDATRRQLETRYNQLQVAIGRRGSFANVDRDDDRDAKRRRMSAEGEYMSSQESPRHMHENGIGRPPPLSLSLPIANHTSPTNGACQNGIQPSNGVYSMHVAHMQMPDTPSASSATSSPSVSQPPRLQTMHNMTMYHESPVPSQNHTLSHNFYTQTANASQFNLVKVEEDSYNNHMQQSPTHENTHCNPYVSSMHSFAPQHDFNNSWHAYSAERAQVHPRMNA